MSRNSKGQFQKGNSGGPGRPKRPTETAYLNAVMNACDIEDWEEICRRAVSDAKNGDAKARDWLGKHLIGSPTAPAPTLTVVQLLALAGVEAAHLERAKQLRSGDPMASMSIKNQVEENEKDALEIMKRDGGKGTKSSASEK